MLPFDIFEPQVCVSNVYSRAAPMLYVMIDPDALPCGRFPVRGTRLLSVFSTCAMSATPMSSTFIYYGPGPWFAFSRRWSVAAIGSRPFSVFAAFVTSSPIYAFGQLPFATIVSGHPFLSMTAHGGKFSSARAGTPTANFPFSSEALPIALSSLYTRPFGIARTGVTGTDVLCFFVLFCSWS